MNKYPHIKHLRKSCESLFSKEKISEKTSVVKLELLLGCKKLSRAVFLTETYWKLLDRSLSDQF